MPRPGYTHVLGLLDKEKGFSEETAEKIIQRLGEEKEKFLDQHECQHLLNHIKSQAFKNKARQAKARGEWELAIDILEKTRDWYISNGVKPMTPPPIPTPHVEKPMSPPPLPAGYGNVQAAPVKRTPPPLPTKTQSSESDKENRPPTPVYKSLPVPPPRKPVPPPIAFQARKNVDVGAKVDMRAKQEALAKAREETLARSAVQKVLEADKQAKNPLFTLLMPGEFEKEYKRRRGALKNTFNKPDAAREEQLQQIQRALINFNINPSLETVFKLSHAVENVEKNIKDKSSDLRKMCTEMKTVLEKVRSEIGKELSEAPHKIIKPRH